MQLPCQLAIFHTKLLLLKDKWTFIKLGYVFYIGHFH